MSSSIWFCGDPHGGFRHIIAAVQRRRPATIVLLGDVQATKPLQDELAEILSLTEIYWIAGNHDTDTVPDYDHLFESDLRDRNLHGRVVEIAGVKVAGLGGIFREKVWMPPAPPIYQTPGGMSTVTQARCDQIADALKHRPRKRHGFKTPPALYHRN